MGSLMVVELQEAIKRGLERAPAGEILPSERDAPVLVQDRFLQALDETVGPRMAWLRAGETDAEAGTARGEGPLEFLPVVPCFKEVKTGQVLL